MGGPYLTWMQSCLGISAHRRLTLGTLPQSAKRATNLLRSVRSIREELGRGSRLDCARVVLFPKITLDASWRERKSHSDSNFVSGEPD
jgi:hypothetical protein